MGRKKTQKEKQLTMFTARGAGGGYFHHQVTQHLLRLPSASRTLPTKLFINLTGLRESFILSLPWNMALFIKIKHRRLPL